MPAQSTRPKQFQAIEPRTATATSSATKPAPCETTVTPNAGSRFVSEPPAKSAVPQTIDEPSARMSASAPRSVQALDQHCHALAATHAHRLEADRPVHRLEVVQE